MDTIIFIYKKRDLHKPLIDAHQMKDYLLVRVGMDVGENRWFTHSLMPPVENLTEQEKSLKRNGKRQNSERESSGQKLTLSQWWQAWRERKKAEKIQRIQKTQFEQESAHVSMEIQSFLAELNHFVDDRYDCCCVYGDALKKDLTVLKEQGQESRNPANCLPGIWQTYWHFPEFDAFTQPRWVEPLLVHARLHHFVVLGAAPCMPMVLSNCARRMKSLRWFLAEGECTEELQELVEDFYEEYGLAIALHPLEGRRVFTRLLLEMTEPVCVLDFTGEPHIPINGLARDSIWIDFVSVEEKARRILERGEGIFYFSMKETWKRAGKP